MTTVLSSCFLVGGNVRYFVCLLCLFFVCFCLFLFFIVISGTYTYLLEIVGVAAAGELADPHMARVAAFVVDGGVGDANSPLTRVAVHECCSNNNNNNNNSSSRHITSHGVGHTYSTYHKSCHSSKKKPCSS